MHGQGSIVETVRTFSGPSFRGRPTKFTPERIQQINNLVERGKSREEIAELVGVTVGSLAVTCSKLGISLRRRMVNNGVRLLRPIKTASRAGTGTVDCEREAPLQPAERDDTSMSKYVVGDTPSQERAEALTTTLAQFTIRMEHKGVECKTEIALTPAMIEHLVLEAEIRNLRIGELIRDIIMSTVKNDLFREVHGA
jgi:hypothetical protein